MSSVPSNENCAAVRPRGSWFRRCCALIRNLLAVFGLVCLIYLCCLDVSQVVSGSMSPTLQGEGGRDSDWVLSERVSFWFRDPRRWEVVQIRTKEHALIAKRVVGLPGERVSLIERHVAINKQPAAMPANLKDRTYLPFGNVSHGREVDCAAGYYVLGDDSRDSNDSRFEGTVERSQIKGRAVWIVWPLSRIGVVR